MANKNKKKVEEPVIEKSEVIENETMVIDPEVFKTEAPEEQEITPEDLVAQEEFIFEEPTFEAPIIEENEPCVEPCACEQPCQDPCVCDEQVPEIVDEIAKFVDESIIEELKALAPEPKKVRTVADLNGAEFRLYRRTGIIPQ